MRTFKKVLLIDDDEINNLLNSSIIRKLGLTKNIDSALNGQEGLDYLQACKPEEFPDLIFLDIHMPIMNGFEFLDAYNANFKAQHDTIILMMLTTSVLKEDYVRAVETELVKEFIHKPLTTEKLKLILERHHLA